MYKLGCDDSPRPPCKQCKQKRLVAFTFTLSQISSEFVAIETWTAIRTRRIMAVVLTRMAPCFTFVYICVTKICFKQYKIFLFTARPTLKCYTLISRWATIWRLKFCPSKGYFSPHFSSPRRKNGCKWTALKIWRKQYWGWPDNGLASHPRGIVDFPGRFLL